MKVRPSDISVKDLGVLLGETLVTEYIYHSLNNNIIIEARDNKPDIEITSVTALQTLSDIALSRQILVMLNNAYNRGKSETIASILSGMKHLEDASSAKPVAAQPSSNVPKPIHQTKHFTLAGSKSNAEGSGCASLYGTEFRSLMKWWLQHSRTCSKVLEDQKHQGYFNFHVTGGGGIGVGIKVACACGESQEITDYSTW